MKKSFVLPAILFCIIMFIIQVWAAFILVMASHLLVVIFLPIEIFMFVQLRRVIISGATYLDGP